MQLVRAFGPCRPSCWLISSFGKPLAPCRVQRIPCRSSDSERDARNARRFSSGEGFGTPGNALRESLAGASTSVGRQSKGTHVVLGTEGGESKWRQLDAKVNEYPSERIFKAIGHGGEEFVVAMQACVEQAMGYTLEKHLVSQRPSSSGKYVSVTIGPITMDNPDQVLGIFTSMRADARLKFCL